MTKFNFTEEQIRQAQKVADLMVTLNRVGDGSYGKSTEDVEKFIKIVNGIEDNMGEDLKVNVNLNNKWESSENALSGDFQNYLNMIKEISKELNTMKW